MPLPSLRVRSAPRLPLPPRPGLELSAEAIRRIELTVACRDADQIPKVRDAGEVKNEGGIQVQVMHEGSRVVEGCYHGLWMTETIRRLRGHHEPQEELVIHRLIERIRTSRGTRTPVMVELGCFWSYYSIWAMRATGTRAVLVEPDPANLAAGRANLDLNRLDAEIVNAAVGGDHGSSTLLRCESDGVQRELPVVSVAGLMSDRGIDRLDLLQLDVQGAELDVVERAREVFAAGRIRFVVVSTHHHSISGDPMTHQCCLAELKAAGAHVVAEHTVGESCSGDGLIAVSFDPPDSDFTVQISYARYRDSLFGELEPELAAVLAAS